MRSFMWSLAGALTIAGAYVISQPAPSDNHGELQFPVFSTPPTCDAGRSGRVYYDSDDTLPYYCNGTAWTTYGVTISGTNPYLARFNSAGTNIETSDVRNTGVPAAGTTGSIVDITKTLNAMDGSDTVEMLWLRPTNANHTGASNVFRALFIGSITADDQASEWAISVSTGWDLAFRVDGMALNILSDEPAAGTSGAMFEMIPLMSAMNGSDTVSMVHLAPNQGSVDDTGTNNFFYGINIDTLAPDADVTESAIFIEDDWDRALDIENGFTEPMIYARNSTATSNLFDSADATPNITIEGNGTVVFMLEGGIELTHLMGTDLAVVGTNQNVDPDSNTVEISAASAASVQTVTAPTSTNHTEEITFVCADANVTFVDSDAAGAANTLDLVGTGVGLVCTQDDTLTLKFLVAPGAGNARWVEVSRSVN